MRVLNCPFIVTNVVCNYAKLAIKTVKDRKKTIKN